MYILNVIPIAKSAKTLSGHLSYYFKENVPAGSIVTIPLRNQTVPALVLSATPLKDSKAELKSQSFGLKKVISVQKIGFFSSAWMQALEKTANYHATSLGGAIATLVPQNVLESLINSSKEKTENKSEENSLSKISSNNILAVQGNLNERQSAHKSIIRENFAQKKSVLVISPTKEGALQLFESLSKGLEEYSVLLDTSNVLKNKSKDALKKTLKNESKNASKNKTNSTKQEKSDQLNILNEGHPLLIVSTPSFLAQATYTRNDLATIILDEEYHSAYRTLRRPFIDLRYFIMQYCIASKTLLYLSDSFLRIETLKKITESKESESTSEHKNTSEDFEITEHSPFSWRSISSAKAELIDMRTNKQKDPANTSLKTEKSSSEFKIFSDKTLSLIDRAIKESKHMVIFALRKGVSPLTICNHCQTVVTCKKCSATVVLHKKTGGAYFMCHKCGEKRDAQETCINCGSWNLTPLGIGIDSVYEKTLEHINRSIGAGTDVDAGGVTGTNGGAGGKSLKVFKIDSESIKTAEQAKKIIEQFFAEPGSILIGTEMMFNYLNESVDFSAVTSLDSLFSLPDYRIGEKIIHILNSLREITSDSLILQTRKPDEPVLDFAIKGNLNQYYDYEISLRKSLCQPPFFTHIKFTVLGNKVEISNIMHALQNRVQEIEEKKPKTEGENFPLELDVFPAFIHTVKGKSILHGLVRVPNESWPHLELISFIQSLPPSVTVKINPDSLL